ncbi:MAG: hypothetical protein L0Y72_09030 [Gemmataceae bacterium]|nr:hypothetical protein [Gemmataceae bacterium]MCI0739174.1 hypothetical protein [Gemmataceae bacterium]
MIRIHRSCAFWLSLFFLTTAPAQEANKDLATQLRNLEIKLPPIQPEWMKDLRARRDAANKKDVQSWHQVLNKAHWESRKKDFIGPMRFALGVRRPTSTEPTVVVAKTIAGDGFVIENLLYESRPGVWVTANLYAPAKKQAKMPGILIIHSHHNPKTQGELQDMGMLWARLGCYVLIPDQLGHGERRQHPFTDPKNYPESFKVGRQDYYFRYNVAAQLHLVGESLIGWMAHDMMRGVDLLLSKPGINKDAIILMGSVAGGGDPAAVTAALDERITCAVPFNFGGPQPETKYPLPFDAKTSFNYLGGGSWESTRGLRGAATGGFQPWAIVGSIAPRKLIYAHEFAWDKDRDPVWKRLQKIYSFYDAEDYLAFAHGRGLLQGKPPEATHCNNIGVEHRQLIYVALKKWFDIPMPEKEYQNRLPAGDLQCWTPELQAKLKPEPLWQLALASAERSLQSSRKAINKSAHESSVNRLKEALEVRFARGLAPARELEWKTARIAQPISIEFGSRSDGLAHYVMLFPSAGQRQQLPVVVGFAQAGIETLLKQRAECVAEMLRGGAAVCLTECCGMGTKEDSRSRTTTGTSLSATEDMLGAPVALMQLRDLRTVLDRIEKDSRLDGNRIALWADSFAPVNPPTRNLAVPLDAKLPDHVEPGAATLALLTALGNKDVKAVYARGGLVSFRSLLRSPFLYVPHDAIVPGILEVCDVEDIVAALSPRPVRLEAMVDGLNRRMDVTKTGDDFDLARAAYKSAEKRLVLQSEASAPEAVARWLLEQLK